MVALKEDALYYAPIGKKGWKIGAVLLEFHLAEFLMTHFIRK